MRRVEREISSKDEIKRLLDDSKIMRIAINDDLYPYILPLNFAATYSPDGNFRFYIHCAAEGRKISLIQKNNKVGFETDIHYGTINADSDIPCKMSTSYESVIGYGRLTIVRDEEEKRNGLALIVKSLSTSNNLQQFSEASFENVLVLRLDVLSVSAKKHVVPLAGA